MQNGTRAWRPAFPFWGSRAGFNLQLEELEAPVPPGLFLPGVSTTEHRRDAELSSGKAQTPQEARSLFRNDRLHKRHGRPVTLRERASAKKAAGFCRRPCFPFGPAGVPSLPCRGPPSGGIGIPNGLDFVSSLPDWNPSAAAPGEAGLVRLMFSRHHPRVPARRTKSVRLLIRYDASCGLEPSCECRQDDAR